MLPDLKKNDVGIELMVKASPCSRKNEFRGTLDGALKIEVTAVAEKGKANKAVVKLLAKKLGIPKSNVELVSGSTARLKKFLLVGIEMKVLKERLNGILKSL